MNRYYGVFKRIKENYPELINEYPLYYKEAADLYDCLIFNNRDADFFIQQALVHGGSALELGCGSGRITLPFLKAGLKVTAVDLSEDMLSNLEENLNNRKYSRVRKNLTVVKGDMTKLELDNKKYNIIIIGATSIRLVDENFEDFFNDMYELLDEGGCLVFDFEDLPMKDSTEQLVEPMIVMDYMNKDNKLSLIYMQRIFEYKEKRAFVNAMRVVPVSEEKILLSHIDYRIFGMEDLKHAAEKSKFGSCEIIEVPEYDNYFCKMIKK